MTAAREGMSDKRQPGGAFMLAATCSEYRIYITPPRKQQPIVSMTISVLRSPPCTRDGKPSARVPPPDSASLSLGNQKLAARGARLYQSTRGNRDKGLRKSAQSAQKG